MTREQFEELCTGLDKEFVLIRRSRLWYFLGGLLGSAIALPVAIGLVSWAAFRQAVSNSAYETAVQRATTAAKTAESQAGAARAAAEATRKALDKSGATAAVVALHGKWLEWMSNNLNKPTSASQGLFPDRVLVLWTRPDTLTSGSMGVDYRYAVYRRRLGEQGRGAELGQVAGSCASMWDMRPEPGVRHQYRVYRYPTDPAGKPAAQQHHMWLITDEGNRDGWVDGWAGQPAGS